MFRSHKLGRVWGIDIHLHWTFLVLFGFMALSSLGQPVQLLIPLLVFGTVLLHELGHAMAAREYGIPTHDITLYPIGGVARLAGSPRNVEQELVITGAGPAVNFGLAAAAWFLLPNISNPLLAFLTWQMFNINLGLGLFNLLPAFPMDGGRILRALLASRGNYAWATRTAAQVGRGMAWLLGLAGVFWGSFNLVMIGVFVWLSATAELARVAFSAPPPSVPSGPRGSKYAPYVPAGPRVYDVVQDAAGVYVVRH